MAPTCNICCKEYTDATRKKIACKYCEYDACVNCIKTYLTTTTQQPHCMNCKNAWDHDYLCNFLPKTYINKTLRAHRDQLLLERELSYLPATQPYATARKQQRELDAKIEELYKQRHEIDVQIEAHLAERNYLENYTNTDRIKSSGFNGFKRACIKDGCKGFLNASWHCTICDSDVCKDCYTLKCGGEQEHECKPDDIETAKMLCDNTKPCPNCGTGIFKIDGCSQMYCTECKTAFDWKTGRIESGRIHNPHYYEMMRRMANGGEIPREPGDDPCGGVNGVNMPSFHQLNSVINKLQASHNAEKTLMFTIHRMLTHMSLVERIFYTVGDTTDEFNINRTARVQYMLNDITLDDLKSIVSKKDRKIQKSRDISQIIEMVCNVGADLMRQFLVDKNIKQCIKAFEELRQYMYDSMANMSKKYDCVVPVITDKFQVQRIKPTKTL